MSNNEVFETIFKKVSVQIIENNFTDMNVVRNKDGKYVYSNNIKLEELVKMLNRNVNIISQVLVNNLLIEDINSIKKILIKHFESEQFIKNMLKLTYSFTIKKKLDYEDLKNIYIDHVFENMMNNSVIEKILALTPEITFKNWVIRRKKIVIFGYILSLTIMIITFYVFLMD